MQGQKTGGRKAGTPNKPKPPVADAQALAPPPPAGGGGGAPAEGINAGRAGARARGTVPKADLPTYATVRLDSLIPFEHNARTHPPTAIDKLAKLIKAFGFTSPILVSGKHILAGHARRLAAMKLDMEFVPVIDLKHLTKAQQEAVILSDNRVALDSGWDETLLAGAFERLQELGGLDLTLTGFDTGEIMAFLGDKQEPLVGLDGDDEPAKPRTVTCPECQHSFPVKGA